MYHVRIMQGDTAKVYECTHITETHLPDGFTLELGAGERTLRLPVDGDVIFVMNSQGQTIATHRWPPRSRANQERRTES